jgi:hypothetical protein
MGVGLVMAGTCTYVPAIDYPGPTPGKAQAANADGLLTVKNGVLSMTWRVVAGSLRPVAVEDRIAGKVFPLDKSECFALHFARTPLPGIRVVPASELRVQGSPTIDSLPVDPQSLRLADRQPGQAMVVHLASADGSLKATWRAELRDGSSYVRQRISCESVKKDIELADVMVWDLVLPGAEVQGVVDGSPVVAGTLFFAAEHPMSKSRMVEEASSPHAGHFTCSYQVNGLLSRGQPREFRSVVGVTPAGQLRRGFVYYLERERAQPYRQFLHYNNGYEIGCVYWTHKQFGKPGDSDAFRRNEERIWIDAIDTFGRELVTNRNVSVDSFACDFMWDDENLVWQFHEGFPDGFGPVERAAAKYGSHVGVWLSPFGGYPCRPARVRSGRNQGFETTARGLTLACPHYFARFYAACQGMVDQYGVNYFKFDGFGAGNNQVGPLEYAADVDALFDLIARLRRSKPDVFINPSTGSWPSPFWLLYVDSIWRQGNDTNNGGEGSARQKWITYRDGQVLAGVLARSPLYPVSSLMIHGVFINRYPFTYKGSYYDPKNPRPTYDENEIIAEIRSFFATGVNLQELYIAPDLMTPRSWDVLAEAARWARSNSDLMADTHHFAGDPLTGEVYGWASWSNRKAVLSLRNPSDKPASIQVDVGQAFELPSGSPRTYLLKSPWKEDAAATPIRATAGEPRSFTLKPFEVLVFDAIPQP